MARLGTHPRIAGLAAVAILAASCTSEQSGSCYGPDRNLATAYDPGSVGCACGAENADQCLDGVALVCERGRWRAVIDGPCFDAGAVACGACTPYAYCDLAEDAGPTCRAKRNAGASCTGASMCASGICTVSTCVAAPDRIQGCQATWDCGSESIARTICGDRDCEVCVQTVRGDGTPAVWAALEQASRCDCPEPRVGSQL